MDSKIEKILSTFSEVELAFFAKFKKSTYTKRTQQIIENWLNQSNLSDKKINRIIAEKEFSFESNGNNQFCPRCGSSKLITEQMKIFDHSDVSMLDGDSFRQDLEKIDLQVCSICAFDLTKDKKFGILSSIFRKFFKRK